MADELLMWLTGAMLIDFFFMIGAALWLHFQFPLWLVIQWEAVTFVAMAYGFWWTRKYPMNEKF